MTSSSLPRKKYKPYTLSKPKGSMHPLYATWANMKSRCFNSSCKSYKHYGGRGITVCDEWAKDIFAFIKWSESNGWVKGLQIDRINNDDSYRPDNCRYVTQKENMSNKKIIQINNSSGYRGVSRKKYRDGSIRWVSTCFISGKNKVIGTFDDPELAGMVRDEYIDKYSLNLQKNEMFRSVNSSMKRGNI